MEVCSWHKGSTEAATEIGKCVKDGPLEVMFKGILKGIRVNQKNKGARFSSQPCVLSEVTCWCMCKEGMRAEGQGKRPDRVKEGNDGSQVLKEVV